MGGWGSFTHAGGYTWVYLTHPCTSFSPRSRVPAEASRLGRKMLIFCPLKCIFAVFPRIFVIFSQFCLPVAFLEGDPSMFRCYPQRVWRVPAACLQNTHSMFGRYTRVFELSTTKFWRLFKERYVRFYVCLRLISRYASVFCVVTASGLWEEHWGLRDSGRGNACRRERDWMFAESLENGVPAGGMPEQVKCRHDLE